VFDVGGDEMPPSNSFTSRVLVVRCCRRMMLPKLPRRFINYASTVRVGAAISDKGGSDNPRSALTARGIRSHCTVLHRHVDTIFMPSASVIFFLRPSLRCLITAAARTIKYRGPDCKRIATGSRCILRPRARRTSRKRQFWKRPSRSCRTRKTLHRPA
jgi:hypothetical protein